MGVNAEILLPHSRKWYIVIDILGYKVTLHACMHLFTYLGLNQILLLPILQRLTASRQNISTQRSCLAISFISWICKKPWHEATNRCLRTKTIERMRKPNRCHRTKSWTEWWLHFLVSAKNRTELTLGCSYREIHLLFNLVLVILLFICKWKVLCSFLAKRKVEPH